MRAVRSGEGDAGATAGDLRFQRGDARVEFVRRQRVEILLRDFRERVLWLGREKIVTVHRDSVDRARLAVNKPREPEVVR